MEVVEEETHRVCFYYYFYLYDHYRILHISVVKILTFLPDFLNNEHYISILLNKCEF